jgi:hypothetical protein
MTSSALPKPSREEQLSRLLAELGMPLVEHTRNLVPAVVMTVTGAGLFVAGVLYGPRFPSRILLGLVLLGAFLLAQFGVSELWRQIRWDGYRICRDGVILLLWRRIESCRWNEVAAFHFYVGNHRSAVVGRIDGVRLVLNGITAETAQFLGANIIRAQLPPAIDDLNAGREVSFADIAIGRDGLLHRTGVVPWEEFEKIDIREPITMIKRQEPHLYLHELPNAGLFALLVGERLSRGRFPNRDELRTLLG